MSYFIFSYLFVGGGSKMLPFDFGVPLFCEERRTFKLK